MLPIILIILLGLCLMVVERRWPDRDLPKVGGWWARVVVVNLWQLGVVLLGGFTWERWFVGGSLLALETRFGPVLQLASAYLVITFVFYWWHRARHESNFLWLLCHQLHHSPQRIETITSFYKHPLEIVVNGIIIAALNFGVLGIALELAPWVTLVTATAEYFYHMNVRTPRWVGYFLQRPEMHRIHHERGKHYSNFADLPAWDMLFGTYVNPPTVTAPCGFKPEREARFWDMVLFRNVNGSYEKPKQGSDNGGVS